MIDSCVRGGISGQDVTVNFCASSQDMSPVTEVFNGRSPIQKEHPSMSGPPNGIASPGEIALPGGIAIKAMAGGGAAAENCLARSADEEAKRKDMAEKTGTQQGLMDILDKGRCARATADDAYIFKITTKSCGIGFCAQVKFTAKKEGASSKQLVAAWGKITDIGEAATRIYNKQMAALKSMWSRNTAKLKEIDEMIHRCDAFKKTADSIIRKAVSTYRFKVIKKLLDKEADEERASTLQEGMVSPLDITLGETATALPSTKARAPARHVWRPTQHAWTCQKHQHDIHFDNCPLKALPTKVQSLANKDDGFHNWDGKTWGCIALSRTKLDSDHGCNLKYVATQR